VVAGVIEFPSEPAPNGVSASPIDFGFVQRPGSGAALQRVDRPGNRMRVEVTYPPMQPDVARRFVSRLMTARHEGLRIDYPLLGLSQGSPGSPVVDGADPTGTSLPIKDLTPGYAVKEGYALTLIDADGNRYLHFATAAVMADASGDATVTIEPPIRAPLPDGATILLAKPTIEGVVSEEVGWSLSVDRLVRFGGSIVIEEAA
jgi:hypothetical protein